MSPLRLTYVGKGKLSRDIMQYVLLLYKRDAKRELTPLNQNNLV